MQKLILTGNLGEDATVTDLPSGKKVINFSLAVSEKYKGENHTVWYKSAYFTDNTSVAEYLTKGKKVLVEGKPEVETYVNNQGETVANLKCIVFQIELLS